MPLNVNPYSQQISVYNSLIPPEGPKVVSIPLDFTATGSNGDDIIVDFTLASMRGSMTVVQTVWIDNTENTATVLIDVSGTQQHITVPAGEQGMFPVFAASKPKLTFASAGSFVIPCTIGNMPMPVGTWGVGGGGGASDVTILNTPLPIDGANPNAVITSEVSTNPGPPAAFAITVGGTAEIALSLGTATRGGYIHNPIGATETLFVDLVNTAEASEPGTNGTTTGIEPGQTFTVPPTINAVTVNAVTTGHAFSAVGLE